MVFINLHDTGVVSEGEKIFEAEVTYKEIYDAAMQGEEIRLRCIDASEGGCLMGNVTAVLYNEETDTYNINYTSPLTTLAVGQVDMAGGYKFRDYLTM